MLLWLLLLLRQLPLRETTISTATFFTHYADTIPISISLKFYFSLHAIYNFMCKIPFYSTRDNNDSNNNSDIYPNAIFIVATFRTSLRQGSILNGHKHTNYRLLGVIRVFHVFYVIFSRQKDFTTSYYNSFSSSYLFSFAFMQ